MCNIHTQNWHQRKKVYFSDYPQSQASAGKSIFVIIYDHQELVVEGIWILSAGNETSANEKKKKDKKKHLL